MRSIVATLVFALVFLAHFSLQQSAVCRLEATNVRSPNVTQGTFMGTITLTFNSATNTYTASGTVTGLDANTNYGFHVHELGHMSADGSGSASHYNPTGAIHDVPPNPNRHIGDMGNILSDATGTVNVMKTGTDNLWTLNGTYSILGRIIHVHERRDNGSSSQPVGDAGRRIAQCVVGVQKVETANTNIAKNDINSYNFATCELRPRIPSYPIAGRVTFEKLASGLIRVRAKICNLTANAALGFHVHEFGDLTGVDVSNNTGDHYNPLNQQHGYPPNPNRHAGDMGNFTVTSNGVAAVDFTIDLLALSGSMSIIGRSVVVHGASDKGTQPLGAAGERVAACVIGVSSTLIDVSDACPYNVPVNPTPTVVPKKSSGSLATINVLALLVAMLCAMFAM